MSEFLKDSTAMKRIERLHAITEELRRSAPRPVAAQSLADRFGVTRRTIERDVEALRLAGLPMYGQVGRGGGSAMLPTQERTLVSLSTAELVSLIVAAHVVQGAPYSVAASTAIDKLLGALAEPERVAAEALRQRFRLAAGDAVIAPRVLSVVEDAVRTQTVVRITFTDRHGVTTRRAVEPAGFYATPDQWSLVAWCRVREAGRLFRLDRISRAQATRQAYTPRDVDDLLGWVPEPGRSP